MACSFSFLLKMKTSYIQYRYTGLPQWCNDKESTCHTGDARDMGLTPGSGRCSGGGNGKAIPVSLLGKSHGQRSPAG